MGNHSKLIDFINFQTEEPGECEMDRLTRDGKKVGDDVPPPEYHAVMMSDDMLPPDYEDDLVNKNVR